MKLNKWLYGATALAMLAACSDKDIAPDAGGGTAEDGKNGYISINIQLPTAPSTRAEYDSNKTGNDNFDDGVNTEYTINDAVLVLFQGASDTDAVCKGVFNLQNNAVSEDKNEDNDQVTKHLTRVAKVSGINESSNLYALVMVNGNKRSGLYDLDKLNTSWMLGKKISELQETAITSALVTQSKAGSGWASNIFMTNSPLSMTEGGDNDPESIEKALPVLVQLNPKTWPTPAEALSHPASTVNVERAVGKITCSRFAKTTGEKEGEPLKLKCVQGNNTYEYELEVSSVSWGLAQDMSETFVVRNTNRVRTGETEQLWRWDYANTKATATSGKYRMLGSYELKAKDMNDVMQTWYRPYFCRVPGYGIPNSENSTYAENKKFNKESFEVNDAKMVALVSSENSFNSNGAFYPRENTFPVEYMTYANTTRVGFWVNFTFKPLDGAPAIGNGANFYIKGADKTTIYLDNNGRDPLTFEAIETLKQNPGIIESLKAACGGKDPGTISGFDLGKYLKFEYDDNDDEEKGDLGELVTSGQIKIKSIAFDQKPENYPDGFKAAPNFTFTETIIDDLNQLGQYYKYDGGKVFYEVRIKHFGDDLTPWNIGTANATTIEQSYGPDTDKEARNKNYLGRYGIVRNNWYDLEVKTITKLGDPRDPKLWDTTWPGKPDDNNDQYIAVILHVLSWAKRTQSVIF